MPRRVSRGSQPEERLRLHQQQSGPVMDGTACVAGSAVRGEEDGAQLRSGQSDHLPAAALEGLTLFLRQAGAPLDNNICEEALKRAVLHRKNALFYKTLNGAQVGDLFMSLIHTCQLCGANSFEYLTELQRHAGELATRPAVIDHLKT